MGSKFIAACAVSACLLTPAVANAGVFADDLSRCLAQKSSKADKTKFVRWMFSAMSLNPAVSEFANIPLGQRDAINRDMTQTLERVLMKDCRTQALDALKNEGESALMSSFEFFGRTAAMELFSDPATTAELQKLNTDSDKAAWDAFYSEAGRTRPK